MTKKEREEYLSKCFPENERKRILSEFTEVSIHEVDELIRADEIIHAADDTEDAAENELTHTISALKAYLHTLLPKAGIQTDSVTDTAVADIVQSLFNRFILLHFRAAGIPLDTENISFRNDIAAMVSLLAHGRITLTVATDYLLRHMDDLPGDDALEDDDFPY